MQNTSSAVMQQCTEQQATSTKPPHEIRIEQDSSGFSTGKHVARPEEEGLHEKIVSVNGELKIVPIHRKTKR